jgi:molybdopterin/thiamine biosynthesis adenylyltransferase
MDVAFSRNLGILTPAEQDKLANARVAIPGLGGVGGMHCATLARLGLGGFHMADPDNFELANFNRQFGATMRHLGESKLTAMSEEVRQINPHAMIRGFPEGLTAANLDEFLRDVDVVVDGLDFFAFDIRRALFNRARQLGIPVVTAAPLGFTTAVLVFTPDSMSFDDYFAIHDGLDAKERLIRFAVGLAPRGLHLGQMDPSRVSLDNGRGPSLAIACLLCSALAATETVRLITDRPGLKAAPWSLQMDALNGRTRRARPRNGNASLTQRAKLWYVRNVILGGKVGIMRKEPDSPELAPGSAFPPPDHLLWLVQAALQAPSGDNKQPFRFQMDDGVLRIFNAPREDESFFNVHQLASIIACGAAVQNVACAAPGIGWTAHPQIMPDPGNEDLLAALTFTPGSGQSDPLGDSVWTRSTNRRAFFRRPVERFSQDALVEAAQPEKLLLLDDTHRLNELAGLLFHADRIRVERRDLHEYFMGTVRFDPEESARAEDGLPLKNLYAGTAGEAFLRLTRPWAAMRAANMLGLGRLVAVHSLMSMRKSPLAGLVCVDSPAREDFLKGGMALERVWLTATRLGLALQPMTAITLFWVRWRLDGPDAFSRRHQHLLRKIWPTFERLFPGLGDTCWPVMLFRAGYAPPIMHGTPRRKVESLVLS